MDQTRDYQQKSIDQIKGEFKSGKKKVLLWLATGSGKTWIFCKMLKDAHSRGKKAIVVVRGRKLVDQASQRLTREGVDHGVLMAGHWKQNAMAPIQVCSIDTLISRGIFPPADLIIIDEAHLAGSKKYREFLACYNTFVVAVTATPYVTGGLEHVAESIVHPITMLELIKQGYLVNFRYFAPAKPDLSNVKISSSTKDYVVDQLATIMEEKKLTGKIIEHWIKIANGLPTICFCVNIHHSKLLIEKFLAAGIAAEHCDADSSDEERNEIIARLESGETKVVCNVGIFCTGVDIPCIRALIMARPTESKNLFIQQAGRGTRTFSGKENCILLDHAGNIERHGFPTDEPSVDLKGRIREKSEVKYKICKECFAVYIGKKCLECGKEPEILDQEPPEESDDQLAEITNIEVDPIKRHLDQFLRDASRRGYKTASAFHKLVDKFGFQQCQHVLPEWFKERYLDRNQELFRGSPFRGVAKIR